MRFRIRVFLADLLALLCLGGAFYLLALFAYAMGGTPQ